MRLLFEGGLNFIRGRLLLASLRYFIVCRLASRSQTARFKSGKADVLQKACVVNKMYQLLHLLSFISTVVSVYWLAISGQIFIAVFQFPVLLLCASDLHEWSN